MGVDGFVHEAPKWPNEPGLAIAVQAARLSDRETAAAMAPVAQYEAGILEALDGEVPLLIVTGGYAVIVASQAVITAAGKLGHRFVTGDEFLIGGDITFLIASCSHRPRSAGPRAETSTGASGYR